MSAAHFSADWLHQREPFDAAARDLAVEPLHLQSQLRAAQPPNGQPWRVIDLACGMGANVRWLAPRLGGTQEWLVVDHDAALLQRWGRAPLTQPLQFAGAGFEASIMRQQTDLMAGLAQLPWQAAHLVTASAFLDLVGVDWLKRLVALAVHHRTPLLMGLNVDGRHIWSPEDASDARVGHWFDQHQRRDKGMGAALGPDAVPVMRSMLEAAGYRVEVAPSDWLLDGRTSLEARRLQRALIKGMAAAAKEQDPTAAPEVDAWSRRRLALCARTLLRVGHLDIWAAPS